MRVCVPCGEPGGPDSPITAGFEEAEVIDYYELSPDGRWEHTASTRSCGGGGCVDPIDAIVGREAAVVAVISVSPSGHSRFKRAGVRVVRVENPIVRRTLDDLAEGRLKDINWMDAGSRPE